MRIIDKNKDFYDSCQYMFPGDTANTFDRRDSYVLSREEFEAELRKFERRTYRFVGFRLVKSADYNVFLMLRSCNTFWVFVVKLNESGYKINFVTTWKDYTLPRVLLSLSVVDFRNVYAHENDEGECRYSDKEIKQIVDDVARNDFTIRKTFDNFKILRGSSENPIVEERHIPILRDIGIASLVNPLDLYLSLDEYFSQEKTAGERTETEGITDKEKITNHGFDTVSSFRGKNK